MSSPAPAKDNSVELAQMQQAAAEKAAAQERQDAADKATKLAALRSNAATGAKGSAESYFTEQGLVPGDYESQIQNQINQILSGISPDDPNPGAYFSNIGETAYGSAQDAQRNKYSRTLDTLFPANFETARISDTTDDPTIGAIDAEQRQSADAILRNMLARGVITDTGFTAGEAGLDKQEPGVRARLNEIGGTELATGRSKLTGIANTGRQAASTYKLGASFDPYSYGSQVDQAFADFMNNLGGSIRAKAPGNLFDTSGLASIAGAGSGAQNTKFDPNALAGVVDSTDDEKNRLNNAGTSIF